MKKTFLILIFFIFNRTVLAQGYVTVTNQNFASYLQSILPSAMNGNLLDTTNILVTTTVDSINIYNSNISDFSAVRYFKSLKYLITNYNPVNYLPVLPNSIEYLDCSSMVLYSLTTLPPLLKHLNCANNVLPNLPSLPNTLTHLNCSSNPFNAPLPSLPNSITYIDCHGNSLFNIAALPNSLVYFDCYQNYLTNLPLLPNNLKTIICGYNSLTTLPTLPNSLEHLDCSFNQIIGLPTLSSSLLFFDCDRNRLASIPALPSLLRFFDCNQQFDGNYILTSLPSLPNSLDTLICYYNALNSLPPLPNSLKLLRCFHNNISCLPTLPDSINPPFINIFNQLTYNIEMGDNPYTCLPNYVPNLSPGDSALPLCFAGNPNGCAVVANINEFENQIILSIYPNPTNSVLNIVDERKQLQNATIEIKNTLGQAILSTPFSKELNISDLSSGIYFLTVQSKEIKKTVKVVKE